MTFTAFILWQQKTNLSFIKKVCKNKEFCNIAMPFEDIKILNIWQRSIYSLCNKLYLQGKIGDRYGKDKKLSYR